MNDFFRELTDKIIGVTVAADRAWKASRVRGGK